MWYWNTTDCNEALQGIHDLTHCKKMDDDNHLFKSGVTPEGKMWGSDEDGYPVLLDIPGPSHDDYMAMAEMERRARVAAATDKISLLQTKLQLNIITDDEKAELLAWLKYIDDVKAIDVSPAPDISWPEPPED
ncbi:tail fiber assembly protein [Citrobacter sp. S2-9]|uniref:Tail fiber assembly protein n=1 Tax=Citrobacter enshiensis TaxID=2971264 RepID=A0ABT8PNH0_9ENTR|nr:tail fiber assembly protein [Citrobacter enshiensis]MDN8597870.1 tail fiber assembly protein [Citrobacter enshiensis]